ncbi:MAG: aminoglycoside 3'-phosphotransferase [Eubacteriales bacterium]|nr:aminoglycoside 3'-phosphotransferase [Eubacteriales bacterium]
MFDLNKLPKGISNKTKNLTWNCDDVGMSDSTVLLFDDMVLKVEKTGRSSEHERTLLGWLDDILPVPKIIAFEIQDGYSFLLMSKLLGEMACSDNSLRNMEDTIKALVNGLKMLWQIDITNCPFSNMVSDKIIQAKNNIENDLVDTEDFNPETFTVEGFSDVPDLFNWLDKNRPKEELVFSHGDFCLPNIFVSGCKTTGFLDWGCGGIADKWQDIALCVRSLRSNYMEYTGYGEEEYQKYKKLLFRELDIEPDEEKIRYYILLDELF